MSRMGLRERVAAGPVLLVPGAANALTARIVEDVGFEAVYVTGAGVANTFFAVPDVGLVSYSELLWHVEAIRDAVRIPVIVDIDTGFGNALNVQRTVRELSRLGVDAVQIEDQTMPKKCGHFNDKQVISAEEMEQKVRAAADARLDDDVLIIARTDARAVEGFDAAVQRVQRYAAAGADITFLEAPESEEELLSIPRQVTVPQVVNLVEGGRTPLLPVERLQDFGIALFANAAMQASTFATSQVMATLKATGSLERIAPHLTPWQERQRLARKPEYDALETTYSTPK